MRCPADRAATSKSKDGCRPAVTLACRRGDSPTEAQIGVYPCDQRLKPAAGARLRLGETRLTGRRRLFAHRSPPPPFGKPRACAHANQPIRGKLFEGLGLLRSVSRGEPVRVRVDRVSKKAASRRSTICSKYRSNPAGEMISRMRSGFVACVPERVPLTPRLEDQVACFPMDHLIT